MVGIILTSITAGILSCSTAVSTDSNQPTTQSLYPVYSSSTEGGSSSSSSSVDGFTSTASLTPSIPDPTWSVELHHPAWIVWVDVSVPANYGTREIVMTTTNKETVMPCNAMNAWMTTTTLRITCRNVVNATTIILVSTDSMVSKLGLIEMYVYGDCQHGSYGEECGTFCSQNCTEGLCDDVSGTCTCVLGWKGDNCDSDPFSRSNKTHIPADTSESSISLVFVGLVGTGITAVVVLLVVIVVLLVRRHRQHSQRTLEQVAYDDIFNDIPPGWNAQHSQETQSSVDYDVIDITSRDQDEEPGLPFADRTAKPISREEESRAQNTGSVGNQRESIEDYDIIDVISRDQNEQPGKPFTDITPTSREGESCAQNTRCGKNHCESPGSYDVLDVTSRDPDGLLVKPYTDLTATQSSPEDDSKGGYDVLDVTSRNPDEANEKPYTGLTVNMPHQNIPRNGRQESI